MQRVLPHRKWAGKRLYRSRCGKHAAQYFNIRAAFVRCTTTRNTIGFGSFSYDPVSSRCYSVLGGVGISEPR